MIDTIIGKLNESLEALDFIRETKGVAQVVRSPLEEGFKSYPAEYCTGGEYKNVIDFDRMQSLLYHRFNGDVSINENDAESITGCEQYFVQTYPMKLVACIKKNIVDDVNLIDHQIAETIKSTIAVSDMKGLDLGTDTITISPTAYSIDRYQVFEDEFTGVDMNIGFEYAFVSIDYNVIISATNSCFQNVCE